MPSLLLACEYMRELVKRSVQRSSRASNVTKFEEPVCWTDLQDVLLTVIDDYRRELTCRKKTKNVGYPSRRVYSLVYCRTIAIGHGVCYMHVWWEPILQRPLYPTTLFCPLRCEYPTVVDTWLQFVFIYSSIDSEGTPPSPWGERSQVNDISYHFLRLLTSGTVV